MTKNSNNRFILFNFIIISFALINLVKPIYPQSYVSDSSFHPYHVNYWVTAPIIGVGIVTNYLGISNVMNKADVTAAELQALNKDVINGFDRWALNQDPSKIDVYENYSTYAIPTGAVLPFLLLFDKQIRKDWFDVLILYMETITITTNIYEWSFLGPSFQNRLRPVTYYDQLTYEQRKSGTVRNSFYSGHVATVSAFTFFMVKVYSDYNPEIGNNKYLLYGAAAIPPLILGYFRLKALKHFPSDIMVGFGVGALCGIIIPELHRLQDNNISLGMYSSSEEKGIAIKWQPNFLK